MSTQDTDHPDGFRWRNEWAPLVLLAGLTLAVRWLVAAHAAAYCEADFAILGLMSRHIWIGERFPAFYYGQDYLGSFSAWLAAPAYGVLGADPRGMAITQALLFALVAVPVLYRLWWAVGGRAGAVAATLAMAAGTSWLHWVTGGRVNGYTEALVLGALLLLAVDRHIRGRPLGLAGSFGVGLATGSGLWINRHVVTFVVAAGLAWWAAGEGRRRWSRGTLAADLRRTRWGRRLRLALGLTGIAAAVAFGLWIAGPQTLRLGSKRLSFQHPQRDLFRTLALLVGALILLEWYLAADRRRWLRLALAVGLGGALGLAPMVAHKLQTHPPSQWVLKIELAPSHIPRQWPRFAEVAGWQLFETAPPRGAPAWLATPHRMLRWLLMAAAAAGALTVGWRCRRELLDLLRLRPVQLSLSTLLLLQTTGVVALLLMISPNHYLEPRYLVPAWAGLGGLLAGAVGRLTRAGWRRAAIALTVAVSGYYATGTALMLARWAPLHAPHDARQAIAILEREGATRGYADYWTAYWLTYLADERVILHTSAGTPRLPWYRRVVDGEPRPVMVFDLASGNDRRLHDVFCRSFVSAGQIVARWRAGRYCIYRYARRPGPPRTPDLWSLADD